MSQLHQLPRISEEAALHYLLAWIAGSAPHRDHAGEPNFGHEIYIPHVIEDYLRAQRNRSHQPQPYAGPVSYQLDTATNSGPFYAAAWNLCLRGILRPSVTQPQRQFEYAGVIGGGFALTEYGRAWLRDRDPHLPTPTEYGGFGRQLAGHAARFGDGYHVRSQEALLCYQAQAYYACCAMCGAAAESILLAIATAKTGNGAQVLQEYQTSRGRSRIENMVIGQQAEHLQRNFRTYTSLLSYWRDAAAHGAPSTIDHEEAFTALLLLLRFAHFAHMSWDDLTRSTSAP